MPSLPDPPVQLITGPWTDLEDLRSRVAAALSGGIRWVQLRAKARPATELYAAAMVVAPMLRESGGLFVVNDRVDIALASGADGVHLPEDGMPVADARRLLGERAWIARSVHSDDAIRAMTGAPPSAVQYGPVFETASKRVYGQPKGTRELSAASDVAHGLGIPLIAVGGITASLAHDCREHGADAVAVIGAIWNSDDIAAAARDFLGKTARGTAS